MRQLPLSRCAYAVKGAPVINDVTLDDASETGLADMVEFINNSSDAPGTVPESCSDEFVRRFADGRVQTCTEGAHVGGWRTQVESLNLRTLGLGGDSLIGWRQVSILDSFA